MSRRAARPYRFAVTTLAAPESRGLGGLRGWLADAGLFLLAVVFTLLTVIDNYEQHVAALPLAIDAGLGGLACIGVWTRRRWPVGFAVATSLLSIYSIAASGVALIALFTVAVYRRFAVVGGTVLVFAAACFLSLIVRPETPAPNFWQGALGLLVFAGILGWAMFIRARRQLLLSLRDRARRAESEQHQRMEQARQLERQRIAGEMHDVLAHRLSLLSLHAGALEVSPDAPPEQIARAARVVRENAHSALEDLREVIGVLRSDIADEPPQPTVADLPGLIEESRRAGIRVDFTFEPQENAEVPTAVGRTVYRIVQEGLTNARQHAPGTPVTVTVSGVRGDGVTVEVRNPLVGGRTLIPGGGVGLVGLAERAAIAGGRLESGATSDGAFRLGAWLPWPM